MIQFKRGTTEQWFKNSSKMEKLAPGQPGYDSSKNKIKIGDGKKSWAELPYTGGLTADEILSSEKEAKSRFSIFDKIIAGLAGLFGLNTSNDKVAVFTYGTEPPDKDTVGKVYLQYYKADPEVDYIIDYGVDGIWQYQIWNSGFARCWGALPITTVVNSAIGDGSIFSNTGSLNMQAIKYPFTFDTSIYGEPPAETASVVSDTNKIVWLASKTKNSCDASGEYVILSADKQANASYKIVIEAKGRIDKELWRSNKETE